MSLHKDVLPIIFSNLEYEEINRIVTHNPHYRKLLTEGFWRALGERDLGLDTRDQYEYIYARTISNGVVIGSEQFLDRNICLLRASILNDQKLIKYFLRIGANKRFDHIGRILSSRDETPVKGEDNWSLMADGYLLMSKYGSKYIGDEYFGDILQDIADNGGDIVLESSAGSYGIILAHDSNEFFAREYIESDNINTPFAVQFDPVFLAGRKLEELPDLVEHELMTLFMGYVFEGRSMTDLSIDFKEELGQYIAEQEDNDRFLFFLGYLNNIDRVKEVYEFLELDFQTNIVDNNYYKCGLCARGVYDGPLSLSGIDTYIIDSIIYSGYLTGNKNMFEGVDFIDPNVRLLEDVIKHYNLSVPFWF